MATFDNQAQAALIKRVKLRGKRGLTLPKPPRSRHPNEVERQYARDLQKMASAFNEVVRTVILPRLPGIMEAARRDLPTSDSRMDAYGEEFDTVMEDASIAFARKYNDLEAQALAIKYAKTTSEWNAKQIREQFLRVLGLNPVLTEPYLPDLQTLFIRENVDLITSIPQDGFEKVRRMVTNVVNSGRLNRSVAQDIEAEFGEQIGQVTDNVRGRAKLIARDQIAKYNGQLNMVRQQNLGIEKYVWRTSKDARVRETHRELEGETFSWDDPPQIGKQRVHPGQDFQCFSGSHVFESFNVNKIFRRRFTGELTKLIFASGKFLEATPNHPVLTTSGWVPLGSLKQGDELISACQEGIDTPKADQDQVKPTIEQVFAAFFERRLIYSAGTTEPQFHGDCLGNEEVEVIDVESFLSDDLKAFARQNLKKLSLTWTNSDSPCLSSERYFELVGFLQGFTGRQISRLGQVFALFWSQKTVSQHHGLASIASRDASLVEIGLDRSSCDFELLREIFDRCSLAETSYQEALVNWLCIWSFANSCPFDASQLELFCKDISRELEIKTDAFDSLPFRESLERVAEVSRRQVSSHWVYNLETKSGWYFANSIVAKNCRCTAEPIFSSSDILAGTELERDL